VAALQADNVVAIVIDLPVAAEYAMDEARGLAVVAQVPTGEQYGFGVSKDNPGLRSAINDVMAKLMGDGTYDEIYTKWFGDVPR
jgi:ABC-type amino acid transport substrate-binding protein